MLWELQAVLQIQWCHRLAHTISQYPFLPQLTLHLWNAALNMHRNASDTLRATTRHPKTAPSLQLCEYPSLCFPPQIFCFPIPSCPTDSPVPARGGALVGKQLWGVGKEGEKWGLVLSASASETHSPSAQGGHRLLEMAPSLSPGWGCEKGGEK